ncbi:hypothetical protein V1478_007759, partial [Vespula squamosa]
MRWEEQSYKAQAREVQVVQCVCSSRAFPWTTPTRIPDQNRLYIRRASPDDSSRSELVRTASPLTAELRRSGYIRSKHSKSVMIGNVMNLLQNTIGIYVTVSTSRSAVQRSRLGFCAGVARVTVIVLAQGILSMMKRAVKQSV